MSSSLGGTVRIVAWARRRLGGSYFAVTRIRIFPALISRWSMPACSYSVWCPTATVVSGRQCCEFKMCNLPWTTSRKVKPSSFTFVHCHKGLP